MTRLARSYSNYLKVRELIALQECLSDPPEHDETLFIVVHQVYELWFRQILHELDTILKALADGRARAAVRLFRRIHEIQQVLIRQIAVLETMPPAEFLRFRDHLKPASGFQSFQFREVEFIAGLGDARFLASYGEEPDLAERLRCRLGGPTLGAGFDALIARSGFDFPDLPAGLPDAELAARRGRRMQTLLSIYSNPDRHLDLYDLAEAMLEFDENLSMWRFRHIGMVERMIGHKQGTGGSEGVGYLQTTLTKKCFPELWEVRTHLGGGAW